MAMNQNNEYDVTVDLPYPQIQAETRRKDYAYAMLSNIGSSNSEISAITLYFYNSVILNPDYVDFAKCFHKISMVEMHHLDIFATLAYQMGADPRLWSMEKRGLCYWSPAYNNYPRGIKQVIENSLKSELDAIHKYTRQAETICDANVVEILKRIILDEQHHVEILNTMLEQINHKGEDKADG